MTRTILFQFVGRFVFAQPSAGQQVLHVLAVNMGHAPDVHSAAHRVTMAISSGCVDPLGSCQPDLKCISAASVFQELDTLGRLEQCLWFLDGHEVDVKPDEGAFKWDDQGEIFTFDGLVGGGSPIDSTYATQVGGPTAALMKFGIGSASATQMKSELLTTVPLRLATGNVSGGGRPRPDMVEIKVTTGPQPFPFTISSVSGRRGFIRVLTEPYVPTVITFSNLCNHTGFENFDGEFAAMYEVLQTRQAACDRRVPKQVADLNGRIDCHSAVAGTF